MRNIKLFNNQSLQNITFENFGRNIRFEFASSYDGADVGSIICSCVEEFYVNFNETIDYTDSDDSIFPFVVYEIDVYKFDQHSELLINQEVIFKVKCNKIITEIK